MPYQNNKPQPGDQLNVSQGDLLGNFQAIGNMMAPGGNVAGTGGALKLTTVGGDPGAIASTMQIYSRNGTDGNPQIFIEREMGSAQIPAIINCTQASKTANGYTYLPSGMILQWGFVNLPGANTAFTFNTIAGCITFPNACLSVTLTFVRGVHGNNDIIALQVGSLNANGFSASSLTTGQAPEASGAYFMAIGY